MATNVNELDAASKFIYAQLTGNVTLMGLVNGVFEDLAPQEVLPPYVIFSFQSALDLQALPPVTRILTRPIYLVKAVTQGDTHAASAAIANQIELSLLQQQGLVGGIVILGEHRLEPIQFTEARDGVRYSHVGGLYRLFVHNQ